MREITFRAWDGEEMRYEFSVQSNGDILYSGDVMGSWTLMQFTGLKDKNGKEIYEGDLVLIKHWKSSDLFDYSNPFTVEWSGGQICFTQGGYNNFIGSLNGKLEIEVIGNIYESPELLPNEQEDKRSVANTLNNEQNAGK